MRKSKAKIRKQISKDVTTLGNTIDLVWIILQKFNLSERQAVVQALLALVYPNTEE